MEMLPLCLGLARARWPPALRAVGENLSWAPSWAPGGSVASGSRDWGAKRSVPLWGWPGQLWGPKEASLLMKAAMVSSRNEVKVGLEIRRHSDKPTDVRSTEGLERSYLMN